MKMAGKILLVLFVFLSGCNDDADTVLGPAAGGSTSSAVAVRKTTLTFVNGATFPLELVCWAEPDRLVWFSDTQVWDSGISKYVSAVSVGGRVTREVKPSASAFAFYFVNYGKHYRTVDLITVKEGQQIVFEMKNNTLVGELSPAGVKQRPCRADSALAF